MFSGARKQTGAITNEESVEIRKQKYADMVNHFYNLVTDFYEWGWGQSFHFGPRFHNEGFMESIKRAEYYLCSRLGMKRGTRAIDVGCGVGGPMRNMAVFSESFIDGITINQYQVNIGNKYNEQNGLSHLCKLTRGDFQELPWAAETFDVAYAIEATCHSPDRVKTFSGINRVLKPGGLFAGYEWVMLDKYDPKNKDHVRIKEGIEVGNGLPTLQHFQHIIDCLEKSGFEVIEYRDVNEGELVLKTISLLPLTNLSDRRCPQQESNPMVSDIERQYVHLWIPYDSLWPNVHTCHGLDTRDSSNCSSRINTGLSTSKCNRHRPC